MTSSNSPTDSPVRLIVTDFDGVLTDNRVLVMTDGTEAVMCNRADGLACDLLRNAGIDVWIMSTETDGVVAARARKLRVGCKSGVSDKGAALTELLEHLGITANETLFIGNDVNDLPAARIAGWVAAPSDAQEAFMAVANHVTSQPGGAGVLREIVEATSEGVTPWRFIDDPYTGKAVIS